VIGGDGEHGGRGGSSRGSHSGSSRGSHSDGGGVVAAEAPPEASSRFEVRMRSLRAEALAALPAEVVVALAGLPFWTEQALAAVDIDLRRYLDQARPLVQKAGIAEDMTLSLVQDAVDDVVRHLYTEFPRMREAEQTRSGRMVAMEPGAGDRKQSPAEILADLGGRLAVLEDAPPVLAQWARLAQLLRKGAGDAAKELLAHVLALCEANQLGEASEVLEAAGALARTLGGPVAVAEQIARHRIERQFRSIRDRRHLSFFVGRADAMAAFRRLLEDDGPWALHYVGVGGAGKTTFIRHLAVDQAAALDFSLAQIDFDYLSAAYPGRDPGQLVQAIVHELQIFIERPEQEHWLRSILEQVERLRDVAQAVRVEDPIGPIAWPEFQELLGFVASFLESFPRPVIILDTCEELMKLSPIGRKIPSVEATFRLIEVLHERVPRLRVVFAGRRLLAAGGHGWTASPEALVQPLSAPRPYLMLHELRGMTPGEASEVLDRLLPESRRDDPRLRRAILDACPEDGRVNGLVAAEVAGDAAPRFSPYRVVRYGRWVAAEPTLAVDHLERGGDPYIEQRILERIGALEGLLPVIVLLRRFDAAMLARVRGVTEESARATLEELAGHEWTYTHDVPARGLVVEIKASIRDQLEHYLQDRRGADLRAARDAIGRALGPMLREPGAVQKPPELIDAALRAMAGVAAGRAWFALEANIGADWGSALGLTRFLLGDENAAADGESILGCAVRATHVSALIHEHPDLDVSEQWRQIAAAMARPEQIAIVRMLRGRAHLGAIAAEGWAGAAPPEQLAFELVELMGIMGTRLPPFVGPWVIAAVEGLLEHLERSSATAPNLERLLTPDWWASLPLSPGLEAWAHVLRARAAALLDEPGAVGDALLQALMASDLALPATCLDWLPPASLRDRIRLEALRLHYFFFDAGGESQAPAAEQRRALAAWVAELGTGEQTDDGDRLASAWLRYEAGIAGGAPTLSIKVKRRAWGLREPAVYGRFPPAAVTAALLAWDAVGVPVDVSATDAVRIRLARARRTRDPALLAAEVAQTANNRLFVETAQAAALVLGRVERVPAKLGSPAEVIAHWSYQRAITDAELAGAIDGMRPHVEALVALVQGDAPLIAARALATLEEVIELARYTTEPLAVIPRPPERAPAHPDQIEGVIRLGLREAAAPDAPSSAEPWAWAAAPLRLPRAIEAIGRSMPGTVARLAVEEAELLSLRFPDRAARLFQYAGRTFEGLGCTVEAQVARLGWAACREMLGVHGAEPPAPVVPALAGFAARVIGGGGSFPLVERTRRRRPPLRRRARAWARRYADELLLALGLGVGSIAVVIGWLLLDFVALPVLRHVVAIPETPLATATAFLIASGALLLFRARNLRALRNSSLWRSMQALRPWRYRLALRVLDDREGLRLVIERRDRRQTWLVPQPGAGDIPLLARSPDDLTALAEVRDEIERESPLPVTARADIVRTVGSAAWEAPLVAGLPTLVIWRAISRPLTGAHQRRGAGLGLGDGQPVKTPLPPAFIESRIAQAWLDGCGVADLESIRGVAHLVGRPRRLVGSIELERTRPGDRAILGGNAELATRRFDNLDVVLQLAPQDFDQASDATRTELGLLRELASGLIERGARSVLVIPAVAHSHLEAVATEVARALGREPERKLRRLVEAARQCRAAIAGITFADHAIVANEVTLFVAVTDPTSE
jgi:hypothetical protein